MYTDWLGSIEDWISQMNLVVGNEKCWRLWICVFLWHLRCDSSSSAWWIFRSINGSNILSTIKTIFDLAHGRNSKDNRSVNTSQTISTSVYLQNYQSVNEIDFEQLGPLLSSILSSFVINTLNTSIVSMFMYCNEESRKHRAIKCDYYYNYLHRKVETPHECLSTHQ